MRNVLFGLMLLAPWLVPPGAAAGQRSDRPDRMAQLDAAAEQLTHDNQYRLRYQFAAGQTLRWKVVHVATTKTTIKGNTQTSKSHSVSTKVWKVTKVAGDGQATFVHSIEDVDMWQKVSDRPEVRYNSKTDKTPPLLYEKVAETVGVPMFVVTVDPWGRIIHRESKQQYVQGAQFGLEQMIVPLPEQPVRVGATWQRPSELGVRLPDGRIKRIKVRRSYTLKKVQTGIATISVQTQVLTPIHDPKVKANLLQRLNHGTIKFDLDAGRIIHKQMDWDETVINFDGADSMMQYLARFTEDFLPPGAAAAKPTDRTDGGDLKAVSAPPVKPRDGKPVLRR